MNTNMTNRKMSRSRLLLAVCVAVVGPAATTWAQGPTHSLRIERSRATGMAGMVAAKDGGAIDVALPAGRGQPRASDFIEQYAYLFGINDATTQLKCTKVHADALGWTHTSYRQMHNGVPVFSGTVRVHQTSDGSVVAANGECYAVHPDVTVAPTVGERQAAGIACRALNTTDPEVTGPELVIIDPAWYGGPPRGARPAYRIEVRDWDKGICEVVFVDAESAEIIDHWPLIHSARYREV